jgi:hypothetical protein
MLAEPVLTDPGPVRGTSQVHMSKLLLVSFVVAAASTIALIVAAAMIPPGPPPSGPGGTPPPPPHILIVFVVLTGVFTMSWVSVVVTYARDQILRRTRESTGSDLVSREETRTMMATLRAELAEDRRVELAALEERMRDLTVEYGDQRETEGYVNGLRAANRPHPGGAEVRPLHRVPPTA